MEDIEIGGLFDMEVESGPAPLLLVGDAVPIDFYANDGTRELKYSGLYMVQDNTEGGPFGQHLIQFILADIPATPANEKGAKAIQISILLRRGGIFRVMLLERFNDTVDRHYLKTRSQLTLCTANIGGWKLTTEKLSL